ncbi:MAG: site-specific integrase [Rhodanobacteraceae bacterium]
MSRARKPDPTIPAFIDQRKLPVGCYWNRRDRYWYALPGGKRKWLAGPDVMLSDLHAAMETLHGVDRGSLDYMLGRFEASPQFKALAEGTQDDYRYCRKAVQEFKTKIGVSFGDLRRASITAVAVQRLVDKIAEDHPTKANHVKRYLSAAYSWARLRMGVADNPAKGVAQAKERKAHRTPKRDTMRAFVAFLRQRGALTTRSKGSVAPYLWAMAEIAYRCRARSIELREMTDADATDEGVVVRRHKGSITNITAWCPELKEAWGWLQARRDAIWRAKLPVVPIEPTKRPVVVTESGRPVGKYTLNSAWKRAVQQAIAAGVITPETRFGMHGLKHRGVTDSPGKRRDKQDAAGHKTPSQTDDYNHDFDVYEPAGTGSKAG